MDPDGHVLHEPEERFYAANANDNRGNVIAVGAGDTLDEALLRLAAPPAKEYTDNAPF